MIPKECVSFVSVSQQHECWLWTGGTSRNKNHRRPYFRNKPAYRYIYERVVKPLRRSEMLCHKCDNPMCVNPSHLFIGSQKDNMNDAVQKGRPVGRKSKHHPQIKTMRRMAADGLSQYAIAKHLGVDHSTVRWHLSKET